MFSRNKKWNIKHSSDKPKFKIPKRFWVYLGLIVICIVGVMYVLRLPEYQIKGVSVENAVLTPETNIKSIADEYLSYTYFYFIPQSNIWLYPKDKIRDQISSLPSIDGVKIVLGQNNTLSIEVKEKNNKFLWCSENNNCFYMNERGFVFAEAPQYEGNVFLTFRGQMNGEVLGKYFLTEEKMRDILEFIFKLRDFDIEVVSVDVKSGREVSLTLRTGTVFIISMEKTLDDTYRNLKTLLESRDFMDKSGGIEKIDYIDLRYGKKAFWKAR
jgi:cell division septal protein FtsQ